MDGLRATVSTSIRITIHMRANDKERVRDDVDWNQESAFDPRHYVGIWKRSSLCLPCVYTHINVHTRIRANPTTSPR